jgi:hypothetical protein
MRVRRNDLPRAVPSSLTLPPSHTTPLLSSKVHKNTLLFFTFHQYFLHNHHSLSFTFKIWNLVLVGPGFYCELCFYLWW